MTPHNTLPETRIYAIGRYSVHRDRFGHYIIRRWKGNGAMDASVYLQGDDSIHFQDELEALERIKSPKRYNECFENVCGFYDDVMT